jgi:hypothetical protein
LDSGLAVLQAFTLAHSMIDVYRLLTTER